jgi:translocator protein
METKKIFNAIFAIAICQFAGIIGSFFTVSAIPNWYAGIEKPFFTPPSWVFAPAWITLYTLMGIALYLVWQEKNKKKISRGIAFFGVQLVLNALWSVLFFGLQSPFYAFMGIIVLWLFIALTIKEFYFINRKSAYLLVPYFVWVSFAMVLNYSIMVLN